MQSFIILDLMILDEVMMDSPYVSPTKFGLSEDDPGQPSLDHHLKEMKNAIMNKFYIPETPLENPLTLNDLWLISESIQKDLLSATEHYLHAPAITYHNNQLNSTINEPKSPSPVVRTGNEFQYILRAATSMATKVNEETMTYLNQGISILFFINVYFKYLRTTTTITTTTTATLLSSALTSLYFYVTLIYS